MIANEEKCGSCKNSINGFCSYIAEAAEVTGKSGRVYPNQRCQLIPSMYEPRVDDTKERVE